MSQTIEIPPRSGAAFVVEKGQAFTVIDPQGSQVSDMIAFARDDVREVMSNGRTFDYEETIRLTEGNRLWSNRSNVMLTIEEDSLGQHDYLLTPCSEDTFRHFYPGLLVGGSTDSVPEPPSTGTFMKTLNAVGIASRSIP